VSTEVELVRGLFVAQERWGWEYVDPAPAAELDEARRPVWLEPPGPDMTALQERAARGRAKLPKRLGLTAVAWLVVSIGSTSYGLLALLVGGGLAVTPWLVPTRQISSMRRSAQERRAAAWAEFEQADRTWVERAEQLRRGEQARRSAEMTWFPLGLLSSPSRVDVFGGTGDGWASLLTTAGASVLAAGRNVLVLDLSEAQVASGLAPLAASWGVPVTELELPRDQAQLDLVGDLPAEDLAEVLADAVGSMRPGPAQVDLQALDAELLRAVADRLDGPVTAGRLAAGLNVLRRVYDLSGSGPLSTPELARLTSYVDGVGGQRDQVQQELQFLAGLLDLLASADPPAIADAGRLDGSPSGLWPGEGLVVVSTFSPHLRRKDVLDRVLFARTLHELRSRRPAGAPDVLVVAGADHLGRESLEAMARQARRVGVRLVLLMERLRSELRELLGSSDSAAVLMRLGNAQDAAAAAEFIGRGHRFVLSQLTEQAGRTLTEGTATSTGGAEGTTVTDGTTRGHGPGGVTSGRSKSVAESRTRSWQDTASRSQAESTMTGETRSRVYEFAVEPTTIQALPATAFILVEAGGSGRRVVLGDCNPGICLYDRVAAGGRPTLTRG
jgi:hypothetical protein